MARTGRVSTIVLGAFQVAENGDLANWNVPATGAGGIGGAMDLAAGGGRIIAMMFQCEKNGASKLVDALSYPPTARRCVQAVVTDLAYFDIDGDGFLLREIAPGLSVDDVRGHGGANARGGRRARDAAGLMAPALTTRRHHHHRRRHPTSRRAKVVEGGAAEPDRR